VVFLPAALCSFINYDDADYVTGNRFVKNGLTWTDIQWAFTTFHASNWHPLTWLSHMLDCQLFRLNPGAHHFVNVLWHVMNVALLLAWLIRLTGKPRPAALVTALFAWHPMHVASVAWVSERKDVLSTFFALLALNAYTIYAQENKRRSLWWALVFFALGLLAKPMLVTLPFVMLLLDYWPLKRLVLFKPGIWVEKIPFFALSAASCAVTYFAQKHGDAVASLKTVSIFYRLENTPVALVGYMQKLFVPTDLCIFYPMRYRIFAWEVILSTGVLVLISVLAWRWRLTRPYFLMGWLWFVGTLMPVIGIVQVGAQAMADRYTYFPAIGFFIMFVFLLGEWLEKIEASPRLVKGLAVAVCAGCILGTEYQLQFWLNSETLFRRAMMVTRDNGVAALNLGAALEVHGRLYEAQEVDREALRLEPNWYQIHNNIGNILGAHGQFKEATVEYKKAIERDPKVSFVHRNLGIALTKMGNYDAAMREFSEAERLDPLDAMPHMEMATLYLDQGRDSNALEELHQAINLQPENPELLAYVAHVMAANQETSARDSKTALTLAVKANSLAEGSPTILDALGMAEAENGNFTDAVACAQSALIIANDAEMKITNGIRARLELYQKQQPWRESFLATNAPVKLH